MRADEDVRGGGTLSSFAAGPLGGGVKLREERLVGLFLHERQGEIK